MPGKARDVRGAVAYGSPAVMSLAAPSNLLTPRMTGSEERATKHNRAPERWSGEKGKKNTKSTRPKINP